MDLQLSDKKALIISSSKGIGKGVAIALAKENCNVIICSSNIKNLEETRNQILKEINKQVSIYEMDLSSIDSIQEASNQINKDYQGIDILITNSPGPKPIQGTEADLNDLSNAMQINFYSVFQLCQNFIPHMLKKKFGRIINLSSTTAREPEAGMFLSNACRAAVISYTKTLSREIGKEGITVNSILTGGVLTDRTKNLLQMEANASGITLDKIYEQAANNIPVGHIATPEEFASNIVFLSSPLSSYINGVNIPVDGGFMSAL